METCVSLDDDEPIAIVGKDQTIQVFNVVTGKLCKVFSTEEVITCMAGFSPLFTGHSGMQTGFARFVCWNPTAGQKTFQAILGPVPLNDIEHILHCKAAHAVITGQLDGTIRLWDDATGDPRAILCKGTVHPYLCGSDSWKTQGGDRLKALRLDRDLSHVLACRVDGQLRVWSLAGTGGCQAELMSLKEALVGLCGCHAERKEIPTIEPLFSSEGREVAEAEPAGEGSAPEVQPGSAAARWVEETFGGVLVRKAAGAGGARSEEVSTVEALQGMQRLGVYIGGRGCGYCPPFLARLKEFYKEFKELDPKTEFIWVPSTSFERESTYQDYFFEHHGDWLMMPRSCVREAAISTDWNVDGVPVFITLKVDGTVLNSEARDVIESGAAPGDVAKSGDLFKPAANHSAVFNASVKDRFLQPTPAESVVCAAFGDGAVFTGHCDRRTAGVRRHSVKNGEVLARPEPEGIIALELMKPRSGRAALCAAVGSQGVEVDGAVLLLDPGILALMRRVEGFRGLLTCLHYAPSTGTLLGGTWNGDLLEVKVHEKGNALSATCHNLQSAGKAVVCMVAPAGRHGVVVAYDLAGSFVASDLEKGHEGAPSRQGTGDVDVENPGERKLDHLRNCTSNSFRHTSSWSSLVPVTAAQEETPKLFEAPPLNTFKHLCHNMVGDLALSSKRLGQLQIWRSDSGQGLCDFNVGGSVKHLDHCPNETTYMVTSDGACDKFWSLDLSAASSSSARESRTIQEEWLRSEPVTLDAPVTAMAVACGTPAKVFLATGDCRLMQLDGSGKVRRACVATPCALDWLRHRSGRVVGMRSSTGSGTEQHPSVSCWLADGLVALWWSARVHGERLSALLLAPAGVYVMCDRGSLLLLGWDTQEGIKFHNIDEGPPLADQAGHAWPGCEAFSVLTGPVLISGQVIHLRVWSAETGEIFAQRDDLISWVESVAVIEEYPYPRLGKEHRVRFYTGQRDGMITQWVFSYDYTRKDDGAEVGWTITPRWQIGLHSMGVSSMCHRGGKLWSMSGTKIVALDESALERWNIVSLRTMGADGFTNALTAYVDGWAKFFKQLVMIWFTTYQLACFAMRGLEHLKGLPEVAQTLQMLGTNWIPGYRLVFFGSLFTEMLFVFVMYFQELVEWQRFMQPDSKIFKSLWLFCSAVAFAMSGPCFLPVFKYLTAALYCEHGKLPIVTEGEPPIYCGTAFHTWAMALPAVVMMTLGFWLSYRLKRCGGQLELVDFRPNPLDYWGDIPLKPENTWRCHRLVYKTTRYELVSLVVKMVFVVSSAYAPSDVVAYAGFVLGILMLVYVDLTTELYWDVKVFGVNPTRLQTGLDVGLLVLFLGCFVLHALHVYSLPLNFLLVCCLPFAVALAYVRRASRAGADAAGGPLTQPLLLSWS